MTGGADDRGGRPAESASFEAARVGRPGRVRPPVLGFVFLAGLAVVVAAGLSGRSSPGAFPVTGENITIASGEPPASIVVPTPVLMPAFPEDTGPVFTSAPGPMQVQAKRHPQSIFVHGDIDASRITWVYVGVLDDVGRVAGWTSVSLPGTAGPNASGGPTMRFDVELAIPSDFEGRLWVRAQAYDSAGKLAASARVEIPPPES